MIEFKNMSNEVYITDIIDEWCFNAQEFKDNLNSCGDEVTIYINSPGGDVFLGNTMANIIRESNKKVNCVITGLCASIATQIAIACDNIKMYKNSLFMVHLASCGMYGNKEELLKQVEILDKIDNNLAQAYVDICAKHGKEVSKEDMLNFMSYETWFTADEALNLGLIDEIIDNKVQLTACADIDKLHFKNIDIIKPFIIKEKKVVEDTTEQEKLELYNWLDNFKI